MKKRGITLPIVGFAILVWIMARGIAYANDDVESFFVEYDKPIEEVAKQYVTIEEAITTIVQVLYPENTDDPIRFAMTYGNITRALDQGAMLGDIAPLLCYTINCKPLYVPSTIKAPSAITTSNPYILALYREYILQSFQNPKEDLMLTPAIIDVLVNEVQGYVADTAEFKKTYRKSASTLQLQWNDALDKEEGEIRQVRAQKRAIGNIISNKEFIEVKNVLIPSYEWMGEKYIAVADLRHAGYTITWDSKDKSTTIEDYNQLVNKSAQFDVLQQNTTVYMGQGMTYINYQAVPTIIANEKTLISTKWLPILLNRDLSNVLYRIRLGAQALKSNSVEPISIEGINIWWDGDNYVEKSFVIQGLQSSEQMYYGQHEYDLYRNYTYAGCIIREVNGIRNKDFDLHRSWLANSTYHTAHSKQSLQVADEIFKPTTVTGTMNYSTNGFQKGEKLEVYRAHSGVSYYVFDVNRKIVKIPWNSIRIINVPTTTKEATKEQIEEYVNQKGFSSPTPYMVWTDLYRQRTYVLQGSKNNWKLIKSMLSSTGRDITPTPRGTFSLIRYVPYFGKGYMAKNAVAFIGSDYLYHSVLYDSKGKYLLEGRGVLGQKASQGCIRFSPEDSEWFYKTMPLGTTVYIN